MVNLSPGGQEWGIGMFGRWLAHGEPGDPFETPELEAEGATSDQQDDVTAFGALTRYVEMVSWDSYKREDFDRLVDAAKGELQRRNFHQDEGKGFLSHEIERFRFHFSRLPMLASWVALGLGVAVALITTVFTPAMAPLTPLGLAAGLAASGALVVVVFALLISRLWWFGQHSRQNIGITRLLGVRQYNFHVLKESLKQLQIVASEKAQNEEPDKGASGLLQNYLTFICGYVLQKTIVRCFTRYRQYLDQIEIPAVRDRSARWYTALVVLILTAIVLAAFSHEETGADTAIETVETLVLFLILPTLAGLVVHEILTFLALRKGGDIDKRRAMIFDAYQLVPSDDLLRAFGYQPTDHNRFDFPTIYSWNDVKAYAEWFYRTLVRFEKHKDRVKD